MLLTAALSCEPKETDYFLTAASTRPIGNLTGLVSVGAAPINGATLALTGPENRTTTTASTGVYSFMDLTLGDYTVTATATGFNCPAANATILAFQTTTLNIVCTPQVGSVNGTILLDLAPVAGVAVTARQGTTTVGSATTGSNGTYTIPNLLPGLYTIGMTPPPNAVCPTTQRDVTVQSNLATTADFDCTSAPGSVTGTVRVDAVGRAGVTVTMTQGTTTIGTATTGAGGSYTLPNVQPGSYTVAITPPAGTICATPSQNVTIQSNVTVTANFDCTSAPGSLTGTVRVDAVGRAGVTVTMTQGTTTIGTATTVAGGAYAIPNVQPGSYTVAITPPAGTVCATASQNVTIQSNVTATANFDCISAPGSLTGTVRVDAVGRAGVTVTMTQGTTTIVTATTVAGGAYTIPNVQPGSYTVAIPPPAGTVCATPSQNVTIQSNVTATANFDCTSAPGSVTGAVRLNDVGQSGVTVTLTQGTTTIGTATTAAGGTYTISNVQPGSYTVAITPPAGTVCATPSQNVTIQSNVTATANFDCTSAPGSVTGAVLLNDVGQSGVTVTLTQGATTVGTATTAAGGTYTISNVQPGTYTATITPPTGAFCSTNPQTVTVQSNQAATANFDCINFTVNLSDPPPSYRHISAGSSETCTGITTTPAQPGASWTTMWTGTGTVGATQRSGTLDASGMAVDRQPIDQLGTFSVNVSVTSGGATRSGTGSVTVQAGAGTCPP